VSKCSDILPHKLELNSIVLRGSEAVIRKAREKGDFEQEDDLSVLVDVLDSYISGRTNKFLKAAYCMLGESPL
jgi:hypothetical protein